MVAVPPPRLDVRVRTPSPIRRIAVGLLGAWLLHGRAEADGGSEPPRGVSIGPSIDYAARPSPSPDLRACSARSPICVHTSNADEGSRALAILSSFERSWETLTGALALPRPDVSPSSLAYDVYLDDLRGDVGGAETRFEARDVRSRVDRGRAFTIVDRRFASPGCALDTLAAESLARASLYRASPATEEGTARAQAAYLATLAFPCATAYAADAVLAFQSHPERAFVDPHATNDAASAGRSTPSRFDILSARGAALFWARLDWAYGTTPGVLVTASWALSPTMTPLAVPRWQNEPDTFDVLRMSFKSALSSGSTVHDLWLDFGVARAFFGSADDRAHAPELATLGDSAKVPLEWDIPWPDKPRRLATRHPVYPTGASYLSIHHAGAPPGARLRVEIEWEEHALFRWAFVKIDAQGRELGRVQIPTTERATQASMTLVDLDAVDRVLLVGVNVGDPTYPFDPDDEVWEPHGWLVTVANE